MEKEEIRLALASLIEEEMPELGAVEMDKDIISEYGINSVSIIRIIVAAEGKFGISFSDYELALDGYKNFGDMAEVIKAKVDKKED